MPIDENEKNKLLEYNNTRRNYREKTLHQLVEEQVSSSLRNIAFSYINEDEIRDLTYEELNEKANQLARHLCKTFQVQPGQIIAVCLRPGFNMVISVLAVWKAGCVCLLLDSDMPVLRIQEQLEDSKTSVLISNDVDIHFELSPLIKSFLIDENRQFLAKEPTENLDIEIQHTAPACVFYTSGSTGKPKGVLNGHFQFVNSILDMQERFNVNRSNCFLLLTNCTFDPIIPEIVLPLTIGARCIIIDRTVAKNPLKLKQILEKYPIDIIQLTPITLQLLVDSGWVPNESVKILCGGETLKLSLVNRVKRIYIRYGTTETTTYSTEGIYQYNPQHKVNAIPIGKPIANTQIYILDENMQLVPSREVGEIYIGGNGVALGYLNEPKLTQEKFIANPFNNAPNVKLYRTGDYGTWTENGEILFLGRQDNQIKIHGYRINLEQIENYAEKHHAIQQCVVVFLAEENLQQLVAFVILKAGATLIEKDFNAYLANYLQGPSIPAKIITLKTLPLSFNGKVDRGQLKHIAQKQVINIEQYENAGTLRNLWGNTFNMDLAEIRDDIDFFHLGGNSIQMQRLINAINSRFLIGLSVVDFCKNPTIMSLEQRIHELQEQPFNLMSIKPQNLSIPSLLSYPQTDIWNAMQLQPEAYNSSIIIEFAYKPDILLLNSALRIIIQRHKILSTQFFEQLGQPPKQIVNRSVNLSKLLETQDVSQFIDDTFQQLLSEKVHKPFDLTKDLPIRATLLVRSDNKYILLICASHIVLDGYSEQILCYELLTLYHAFINKQPDFLPQLPIQYVDFATWQRNYLTNNESIKTQLEYWEQELTNLPFIEIIKENNTSTFEADYTGKQVSFKIPAYIKNKCTDLAKQYGCTLYNILFTVFNILLHRYTDQNDIAIGTASSGRYHETTNNLIGHFVNILIMRNKLNNSMSFLEFLSSISQKTHESLSNQIVPYSEILKLIRQNRDIPPEIMFVFMQNSNLQFPEVKIDPFHVETRYAKYPLTMFLSDDGDVITGAIEFKMLCYNENKIHRFIRHYQRILEYCLANPYTQLSEIPLLSDQEKQVLLSYGIGEKRDIPKTNIVNIFEEVAKKYRNNIALTYLNEEMTYAELNIAKNKLANYLDSIGVKSAPPGSEQVVAIYMERSFDMYITVLAVLSVGAVYLPLSTTLPIERIKYMLNDSKASIVLTQLHLQQSLLEDLGKSLTIISIDNKWEILSKTRETQAQFHQSNEISSDNLAYTIYTSGSTGEPKGVQIEHQSVINLTFAQRAIFEIVPQDRVLAWAELTFDASVWEWISALLNGATLCIPDSTDVLIGESLTAALTKYRISIATVPPSVLRRTQPPIKNYLRVIISAGEACQQDIVKKWGSETRFYNAYGPTETTVCASISCCSVESTKLLTTIGKPLQNTKLYVLDTQRRLVPIGMNGELCVAGTLLARGYTKEEFTQQSFIEISDPYEPGNEIRIYRTGDIVKWLSDGNLDFVGRRDQQVKIRGFRIELNEIVVCLKQIEFVKDAVVTINGEGRSPAQNIFAYIIIDEEKVLFKNEFELINEIRNYLSSKLLYYMVPSTFRFIKSVPLTSHGKIDYKALALSGLIVKPAQSPPRTETEKTLAAIWASLLHCEICQIDIHDNFFLTGGNSLMLAEMVTRIKSEFKIDNFQTKDITGKGQIFFELARIIEHKKLTKPSFFPQTQTAKLFTHDSAESSQSKLFFKL
jgi:amino acid adenylation domain-containing protein